MSTKKGTLPHIQEMADIAIAAMTEPFHTAGSDEWIETTFRESYVYRVYLRDDGIKVRAKNGIITLTGTVSQEAHKALAEDTASAIAGVIHVNNYLQNSPEDDGEDADAWITRLIKMNLLLHRHVSSARTVVEVKDGTVTLKGEAASPAQKELTGEYAADIEGVREVINNMTVAEREPPADRTIGQVIDDASITAQVTLALLLHRSTSALKTWVITQNGAVKLTGVAMNPAEKALVTKLVSGIRGVSRVKNEMTIEPPPNDD